MKKNKILSLVFILIVIVVLVLPVAFINTEPGKLSSRENRRLQDFPSTDLPIDEFKSQFSSWFNDNLGFRDALLDVRTDIIFKAMGIVSSDLVHKGIDGWYYYKGDNNLDIATGKYATNFLTDNIMRAILEKHKRNRDKLAEKGIEYVVVLPVSKVSVYPEYMGMDNAKIRKTPADLVADYLEEKSDIKVIRLKETLLEKKATTKVYFKTDTHWTEEGAYFAYQKIISDMKGWGLCNTDPIEVGFVDSAYKGEFSNMLGNINALPEEETKKAVIENPNAIKNERNEKYEAIGQALAAINHYTPWFHYENDAVTDGTSVLFYGDSLFGSWNITEELAENFSEFTYVWSYDIDENTVNVVQPKVVVYEMGERYLSAVPIKSQAFSQEIINENDFSMEVKNAYIKKNDLIVEIKNIGTASWSEIDMIRCHLVLDGQDKGYRATIPYGTVVQPGETITFTFKSVSKVIQATETVDIQMLQEMIQYYPQTCRFKGASN